VVFSQRAPIGYATEVPKNLVQNPPEWARSLLERGTTVLELVEAVGDAARAGYSRAQLRRVLNVVEQLALVDDVRQAIDTKLGPNFIPWLITVALPQRPAVYVPAIIVYDNPNAVWPAAWLSPWQDETVWPVGALQQAQLDQDISAVWEDNIRPFVELFLFDGPDLQGGLARIARVHTLTVQLKLQLDPPTLDNQSRSLLALARTIAGRRFSASQTLDGTVTSTFSEWFSQSGVSQFGTASLTEAPRFSWDGYASWMKSGGSFPPPPKTAALRTHLVVRIDDIAFGTTTFSVDIDVILKRVGGAKPIVWVEASAVDNLTQPWAGDATNPRWNAYINTLILELGTAFADSIGLLAGAAPGSIRIFPGRSTAVPHPPATHWGLIEIGRTDDDATIVLFP